MKEFMVKVLGKKAIVYYWSDSELSLKQIKLIDQKYPDIFTANRMCKVHGSSNPDEWWWVDSKSNPADYCTRGIQAHESEKWHVFHRGPDFLWKPKSEWPKQKDWCFNMPNVIRAAYISSAATQINIAPPLPPPPPPPPPPQPFDAVYEAAD